MPPRLGVVEGGTRVMTAVQSQASPQRVAMTDALIADHRSIGEVQTAAPISTDGVRAENRVTVADQHFRG
jgi:ribosomal protein S11